MQTIFIGDNNWLISLRVNNPSLGIIQEKENNV